MKHPSNSRPWAKSFLILSITLFLFVAIAYTGCASGQLETVQGPSVTIVAVGDTNGYNILQSGEEQENPLKGVINLLNEHDAFVFNFEGTLLPEDAPLGVFHKYPNQSLFWSRPQIADYLQPTYLNIATLANNHVLDCGEYGIEATIRELTNRGILTVGAGKNSELAHKPIRQQINGVSLIITAYQAIKPDLFAAGPDRAGAASWEDNYSEQQLAELASTEDAIVVALHLHLGEGWTDQPSSEAITLVKRILKAGADVVIAHGPHVPQGIIVIDGRIALLSLGNFMLHPDYQMPNEAHDSIMAKITISADNISVTLLPLRIDQSGRPGIPPKSEAHRILRHIVDLSAKFGTTISIHEETGYISIHRK